MSDDDFLLELKRDFVNEALFMMDQYEESMLALEAATEPQEHISCIFRVAHSIKGGAAAVGFEDLSKFAHKAEDLLSLLRVQPEYVNTEIITLFLAVGDQFKERLAQLKSNQEKDWDVQDLAEKLLSWIQKIQGQTSSAQPASEKPETRSNEKLLEDFFSTPAPTAAAAPEAQPAAVATPVAGEEDLTNYELLAQLESEMATAAPAVAQVIAAQKELPTAKVEKVEKVEKKLAQEGTILKVDSLRVDSVLDVVGEIVVLKNQLMHSDSVRKAEDARLNFIVDQIDKSIRDLYEKTLGIRMTPLKSLFMKLQRTVRDVSVKLNKPVDLQLIGEETEVDRSVFELLGDPLMHMARNAMDHGIENPEARKASGKPMTAQLTIAAKQVGGSVEIEITEDGRGIDRNKIIQKAIEKGLLGSLEEGQKLSDQQVFQFLFAAGFSTAEKVTDLSGRGVGLDVVRSNIEKIKGQISIESRFGFGTKFKISIPLTTSITDGIVVAICGQRYMVPIHSIREIVQFYDHEVTEVASLGNVLRIRDKMTPIVNLERALNYKPVVQILEDENPVNQKQKTYVVLESSLGLSAIRVDEVIGQSQVVAKPLQVGHHVPEFSGAATLGDGRTILILEPNSLVQSGIKNLKEVA
jgi:two-component system chemotaxis sensor kinase CheA